MSKTPIDQQSTIPRHIGFVMDGNRRWAKHRGLAPTKGHEAGVEVFYKTAKACLKQGSRFVSAYVFSIENWSRTQDEVKFLMGLVPRVLDKYLEEFHSDDICLKILGSRKGLDKRVLASIEKAETTTANNTSGTVALCFNYGGLQEIADMIKRAVESGDDVSDLKGSEVLRYAYAPEIPPCDLVIRTSGEKRLSGFMLPRSEYAELIFEEKFWPDIDLQDIQSYYDEFALRQRRFGA